MSTFDSIVVPESKFVDRNTVIDCFVHAIETAISSGYQKMDEHGIYRGEGKAEEYLDVRALEIVLIKVAANAKFAK